MAFTAAQVEQLYVGYFGRAGDPAGVQYWVNNLNQGQITFIAVSASFSVQPEALAKYPFLVAPSSGTVATFINQVYQNLFNHAPDAAGLAFWSATLNANLGNPGAVGGFIANVISGATGADLTAENAKFAVATDFTTQATNAGTTWNATVQAQSASEITPVVDATTQATAIAQTTTFIAASPGPQQVFTLGVDNLTSNFQNANFNAPLIFNAGTGTLIASLQPGDSATDTALGSGANSNGGNLTAFQNAAGVIANVTLTNIPTLTFTETAAAGVNGNITGVVTINNLNSTAALTVGATNVGIDAGGVAGTTTSFGSLLSTVNINNSAGSATTVFVKAAALAGAADAVTVNVTGLLGGTGAPLALVIGNDSPTVGTAATPMNAYETETINSTGATFANLSSAATGVLSTTTLKLAGAGAISVGANAAGDFGRLTTIDATLDTGGATITGATNTGGVGGGLLGTNVVLTSFKGGAGVDNIDLSNLTATQLGTFTATNLDGGAGTDTIWVSTGAAHGTTVFNDTNFETMNVVSATGGTINVANLGAGITSLTFTTTADTGAEIFTNVTNGLTVNYAGLAGGQAETFTGPAGTADVLNITANNTTGTGTFGVLTFTAFETINETISGTANAFTTTSMTATPTGSATMTLNVTDNNVAGVTDTFGAVNVGAAGIINLSGTHLGVVGGAAADTMGVVTAGTLNASGLGTGATATQTGFQMTSAANAITITGTAGADTLVGSTGADTINGGAGNDLISNVATGNGATAADVITTGTGNDGVTLRGDAANAATVVATALAAVSNITDMTVGTSGTSTDFITLSATSANYGTTNTAYTLAAYTTTAQGSVTVQNIGNSGASAALSTTEFVKLTNAVVTTGITVQAAFNLAIGSATVTGLTADKAYFATMYDLTSNKMLILGVQDHNGTNTIMETGDVVNLIGSAAMTATDYGNITTNHFSIVAA